MNLATIGLVASLLAGLCTGIGALPILFPAHLPQQLQGVMLGIGGGIMLAAASFSLIVPGTEAAIAQGMSQTSAAIVMVGGILLGAGFLWKVIAHADHGLHETRRG